MNLNNILFLDIETCSAQSSFSELDTRWQDLFAQKVRYYHEKEPDKSIDQLYEERAAIFAEFGKIICIGLGYFHQDQLRIKCIKEKDEQFLIHTFFKVIQQHFPFPNRHFLCGHNIREFDIPYICRRAVRYEMELPEMLRIANKKPWEIKNLLDTLDHWKFGDIKHFTSLDLLAATLGLESPKTDLKGSEVGKVYYQENNLDRIATYCMRDVWVTTNVFLRLNGKEPIDEKSVQWIE